MLFSDGPCLYDTTEGSLFSAFWIWFSPLSSLVFHLLSFSSTQFISYSLLPSRRGGGRKRIHTRASYYCYSCFVRYQYLVNIYRYSIVPWDRIQIIKDKHFFFKFAQIQYSYFLSFHVDSSKVSLLASYLRLLTQCCITSCARPVHCCGSGSVCIRNNFIVSGSDLVDKICLIFGVFANFFKIRFSFKSQKQTKNILVQSGNQLQVTKTI